MWNSKWTTAWLHKFINKNFQIQLPNVGHKVVASTVLHARLWLTCIPHFTDVAQKPETPGRFSAQNILKSKLKFESSACCLLHLLITKMSKAFNYSCQFAIKALITYLGGLQFQAAISAKALNNLCGTFNLDGDGVKQSKIISPWNWSADEWQYLYSFPLCPCRAQRMLVGLCVCSQV